MCVPLARPTKREHCTDQLCGCAWDEAVAEAVQAMHLHFSLAPGYIMVLCP